jgi:hypothetical protein
MISIVGMSHTVSVLSSVAERDSDVSLGNWADQTATSFQPVAIKPGMLPGDRLQALVIANQGWEPLATLGVQVNDKRQVSGHAGFIAALGGLQADQEGSTLLSFMNGNGHAALSVLQHPAPFDFVLPGREDLGIQRGFRPLAYELIRGQITPYQVSTMAALYMMRVALPKIRIVHVLPPPPSSEAQIRLVPELFRDRIEEYGVTPLAVRIKYYLLANDILRDALSGYGIEVLEAPPASVGPDGGLLDRYAAGATHGNVEYGQLVVDQLRAML